jgi:hypothetical protein
MQPPRISNADIFQRLGEIATKLDTLDGRVARVETKVMAYDRLKERVVGAFMALSVALAVIWWLTKDRWAEMFGVGG